MRQNLGEKKLERYRRETGLDIHAGQVRGNTNHRVDLFLADGSIMYYWAKSGRQERSSISWCESEEALTADDEK